MMTVNEKGQVTLPREIRRRYGIFPGTKIAFEPMSDGSFRLRVRGRDASGLAGILHKPGMKARSVREMDAGIVAAVIEKDRRSKKVRRAPSARYKRVGALAHAGRS